MMVAVLSVFLVIGCQEVPMGTRPDDFQLQYSWTAASVPPPYHFEYDVTIGPGLAGSIVYLPDYPGAGTPTWTAEFTLSEADLDALYQLIVRQGVLSRRWREVRNPPVGGDTSGLQVQANGRTVRVHNLMVDAARLEPINEMVTRLVPQTTWDTLAAQREQYEREHVRE
jgi:hypothetical protein